MIKGLLSVVITTYCREFDILRQSIDSVLAQTYKSIEIIVVDDNPPDNGYPEKIKAGLADYPKVRYIKMRKNSGACAARNTGIVESFGEFVAFLDDDDLWLPEKAEKQIALFDDPEVGMVFCTGYSFEDDDFENKKLYNTAKNFYDSPTFEDMLWIDRIGSTSQAVIRREIFGVCGLFDTKMPARQDYEMWLRILKSGMKVRGVNQPLFMYRRAHSGEQITKVPKKALDAYIRLYRIYKPDFKAKGNSKADFTALTTLAGHYRRCGHPVKGAAYLTRALFRDPVFFTQCAFKKVFKK